MYEPTKTTIGLAALWDTARTTGKFSGNYVDNHTFDSRLSHTEIVFDDCEIGHLVFDGAILSNLSFRNCKFIKKLEIKNSRQKFALKILNNEQCICEELIIQASNLNSLLVQNSKYSEISLVELNSINDVTLSKIIVDKEFSAIKISSHLISIKESNLNKLTAKEGSFGELNIESNSTVVETDISLDKINQLNFHSSILKKIDIRLQNLSTFKAIDSNLEDALSMSIKGGDINSMEIRCSVLGKSKWGKVEFETTHNIHGLYITGIELDHLLLDKVAKMGSVIIHNSKINKTLNLTGIDISRLEFNILDIRKASFKIHRTRFGPLELINVEWPQQNKAYELEDIDFRPNKENYIFQLKNLKESYRALKVYFIGKQSYFDALVFLTNELRVEQKIKSIEFWHISPKSAWLNFGDWFVLSTNKHFSNFGLSWTRPLLWWLFVFHFLSIYTIVLCSTDLGLLPVFDLLKFQWNGVDMEATGEGVKLFIVNLFPVHDSDAKVTLDGKVYNQNLWNVLFGIPDFLSRIFASYFIFLIVRGTRKFNFKIG